MRFICFVTALLFGMNLLFSVNVATADETEEGFKSIFNGKNLDGWIGNVEGYAVKDGKIVCRKKPAGKIHTAKEYADFAFRFEFTLPPGGNNGIGIRIPANGAPHLDGMEIQILDDDHPKWKNLKEWQYHGSIYGLVPAKRGHLKPAGEWNTEEITADGSRIKVTLNGVVIVDVDLSKIEKPLDDQPHPGINNKKGHIGLLGHGDEVEFRNLRVKEL